MSTAHHNRTPGAATPTAPRLTRRRAVGLALAAGAGGLFLAACGGTTTATSVPTVAPAVPPPAATGAATTPTGGAATGAQKVNANTASVAELTAAFEAAGIANAARWAREVEEYRPYPADDPTFAKLRSNLAKYNPAPGVVDQIVATLSLT